MRAAVSGEALSLEKVGAAQELYPSTRGCEPDYFLRAGEMAQITHNGYI